MLSDTSDVIYLQVGGGPNQRSSRLALMHAASLLWNSSTSPVSARSLDGFLPVKCHLWPLAYPQSWFCDC